MAQTLVRVRMRRQIDQLPLVLELARDQEYDLPAEIASQLLTNGAAEAVPTPTTPRLEAAALAAPRRRG